MVTEVESYSYFQKKEKGTPIEKLIRKIHKSAKIHISDVLLQEWVKNPLKISSDNSRKLYERTFDRIFNTPLLFESSTSATPRIVELRRSNKLNDEYIAIPGYGSDKDYWLSLSPIEMKVEIDFKKLSYGRDLNNWEFYNTRVPFTIEDFQNHIEEFDRPHVTSPEILYANFLDAIDKIDKLNE